MDTRSLRVIILVAIVAVAVVLVAVLSTSRRPPPLEPTPAPTQAPIPSPTPEDRLIWSADLESGDLSAWEANSCGGEFNTGDGFSTVTDAVARSGRYSIAMHVDTDDGEDHATRLMRWCEPSEVDSAYFSAWYYFPERVDVSAGWWNIFQFKSRTEETNDPWWILNVGNREDGTMYIYLRDWIHERSYEQHAMDLPVGEWVHLEVFLRRAEDPTGQIKVWQDGTLLFDVTNVQTNYDSGRVSWGINSYSSGLEPRPTIIYVDDVAMSTMPIGPVTTAGN